MQNKFKTHHSIEYVNKYSDLAARLHINFATANRQFLAEIYDKYKSGDLHLNSISLRIWDSFYPYYRKLAANEKINLSMVDSVCLAKFAALIAAIEAFDNQESEIYIESAKDTYRQSWHLIRLLKYESANYGGYSSYNRIESISCDLSMQSSYNYFAYSAAYDSYAMARIKPVYHNAKSVKTGLLGYSVIEAIAKNQID